jgi:hypothetical protein
MTLTLRNPFRIAYKRMPVYHLIVSVLSLGMAGFISYELINSQCRANHEPSEDIIEHMVQSTFERRKQNLYHKKFSTIDLMEKNKEIVLPLILSYLVVGLLAVFFSIFRLSTELKLVSYMSHKKSLIPYIIYISVNMIIYGFFAITLTLKVFYGFNHELMEEMHFLAGEVLTYGGVLLAIIRCLNKTFRDKLFQGRLFRKDLEDNNQENEWNMPIIEVFNELKGQITTEIFDSLFIIYKSNTPEIPSQFENRHAENVRSFKKNFKRENQDSFISGDVDIGCTIDQLCPEIFFSIMHEYKLSYRSMSESIDPLSNLESIMKAGEGTGKSESFFCNTFDDCYVIKTVKLSEINALKSNLLKYREYLTSFKDSYICKIFGAFVINFPGISPIYLIIMENITYNLTPKVIYDLKGSLLNRSYRKVDQNFVGPYKDLDFLAENTKVKRKWLKKDQLLNDCKFLVSCNFMDYSLLVCKCEEKDKDGDFVVEIKIIDYLTEYKFKKRMERILISILNPKEKNNASAINTKIYGKRFYDFMISKVFENEEKETISG